MDLNYLFDTEGPANGHDIRILDIAFTAFMRAKDKNAEDCGPTDWFTDTLPQIKELIKTAQRGLVADAAEIAISEADVLVLNNTLGAFKAIELAYGLLWIVGCDRSTKNGNALYLARKALYGTLDKAGQARGITAARDALDPDSTRKSECTSYKAVEAAEA